MTSPRPCRQAPCRGWSGEADRGGWVGDTALKVMNKGDVDDEIRHPGHVQTLNLQIPASLAAAERDAAAAVGAKARVMRNVSDCREEKLVTCQPIA